jgi:hypothetical protein
MGLITSKDKSLATETMLDPASLDGTLILLNIYFCVGIPSIMRRCSSAW